MQQYTLEQGVQSNKDWAWWLYLAHMASLVFSLGMLSVIPLILNYLKREDTQGTFVDTHHSWQIRSFWLYVLCFVLCCVLWVTVIGIPLAALVWFGAWIWKAYRLCRGWVNLSNDRAMPL